jgi:hypothetical protein
VPSFILATESLELISVRESRICGSVGGWRDFFDVFRNYPHNICLVLDLSKNPNEVALTLGCPNSNDAYAKCDEIGQGLCDYLNGRGELAKASNDFLLLDAWCGEYSGHTGDDDQDDEEEDWT